MQRLLISLFWLILCSRLEASGAGPQRLETLSFQGREYVRMSTWARNNGLSMRWTEPDQEVQFTNSTTSLSLSHDSRRIRFNGVWVWISAPVLVRDRDVFLPALDIPTTLRPLLTPRKNRDRPLRVICLDAGHGGDDTGKRDGGRFEKIYTLLLAKEVGRLLTRSGYKVIYTRTTDTKVDLPVRPRVATKYNADLFLSLHFNAADVPSAQGVEVYCLTPVGASSTNAGGEGADSPASFGNKLDDRNIQLAYELQRTLVRRLGREDRGLRRARFAVLRDATMPAALIEAGFMSNPSEARWIYSPSDRSRLAQTIVDAVNRYKSVVTP